MEEDNMLNELKVIQNNEVINDLIKRGWEINEIKSKAMYRKEWDPIFFTSLLERG